ncbi:hypothetical protein VC74_gp25 [Mycobacterium phage Sparky]|uniref:Uncharacterized protein n=1 Tax=Mycobacterium phage Sparky TaxID=1527493 RepID=A0A076G977_9CAUD|nr:hypothetical protein VC74_gp25 [Mycobacterium phage Sparky]AII28173.1 hypothetical protein PBI_SPARKY_25 [Mycobacterium phage Sparky]
MVLKTRLAHLMRRAAHALIAAANKLAPRQAITITGIGAGGGGAGGTGNPRPWIIAF